MAVRYSAVRLVAAGCTGAAGHAQPAAAGTHQGDQGHQRLSGGPCIRHLRGKPNSAQLYQHTGTTCCRGCTAIHFINADLHQLPYAHESLHLINHTPCRLRCSCVCSRRAQPRSWHSTSERATLRARLSWPQRSHHYVPGHLALRAQPATRRQPPQHSGPACSGRPCTRHPAPLPRWAPCATPQTVILVFDGSSTHVQYRANQTRRFSASEVPGHSQSWSVTLHTTLFIHTRHARLTRQHAVGSR